MSLFNDLLSKPLPSAQTAVQESTMDNNSIAEESGCVNTCKENEMTPIPQDPLVADTGDNEGDTAVDPLASDNDVPELTPDQSQRVDDTINAVATPLLLKTECTEEEIEEFVESADCDIAVAEGLLTERTIVKFDKNAKKAQLYEIAVASVAREHKDPLYRKLETVYKMERIIKAKLRKKYHAEATKKVKEYLARAKKSKSGLLSRIAAKISGK